MDKELQPHKNYLFSPLSLYFRDQENLTERKGKKTMIGQNGWLEITERSSCYNKQTSPKKTVFWMALRRLPKI